MVNNAAVDIGVQQSECLVSIRTHVRVYVSLSLSLSLFLSLCVCVCVCVCVCRSGISGSWWFYV
jgi:hypothetical protein